MFVLARLRSLCGGKGGYRSTWADKQVAGTCNNSVQHPWRIVVGLVRTVLDIGSVSAADFARRKTCFLKCVNDGETAMMDSRIPFFVPNQGAGQWLVSFDLVLRNA